MLFARWCWIASIGGTKLPRPDPRPVTIVEQLKPYPTHTLVSSALVAFDPCGTLHDLQVGSKQKKRKETHSTLQSTFPTPYFHGPRKRTGGKGHSRSWNRRAEMGRMTGLERERARKQRRGNTTRRSWLAPYKKEIGS